jgi:hypothetical protein
VITSIARQAEAEAGNKPLAKPHAGIRKGRRDVKISLPGQPGATESTLIGREAYAAQTALASDRVRCSDE